MEIQVKGQRPRGVIPFDQRSVTLDILDERGDLVCL
jgi:hypothetical protein